MAKNELEMLQSQAAQVVMLLHYTVKQLGGDVTIENIDELVALNDHFTLVIDKEQGSDKLRLQSVPKGQEDLPASGCCNKKM